jgi:hypothetical protein
VWIQPIPSLIPGWLVNLKREVRAGNSDVKPKNEIMPSAPGTYRSVPVRLYMRDLPAPATQARERTVVPNASDQGPPAFFAESGAAVFESGAPVFPLLFDGAPMLPAFCFM